MGFGANRDRDRDRDGGGRGDRDSGNMGMGNRKMKRKSCRFCASPDFFTDYKEPRLLTPFLTEKGKIIPRRVTGNCAFHQRRVQECVKRARILALLPFSATILP